MTKGHIHIGSQILNLTFSLHDYTRQLNFCSFGLFLWSQCPKVHLSITVTPSSDPPFKKLLGKQEKIPKGDYFLCFTANFHNSKKTGKILEVSK